MDQKNISEVDLHRPYIDAILINCDSCGSIMHRVEEVVDCWVESGAMPFAELHYPFENQELMKERYPAQFVAEYVNQTRAWFYVMHVMGIILEGRAPFQNVLTTGVVLAADGQKMSKSKKNYPDPSILFDKYGVDALRLYMLTSPVMLSENLYFNEKEIDEIYKKFTLMLGNILSFYRMYELEHHEFTKVPESGNVLDKWILAMLHQLQHETTTHLDRYDTVRAGRPVLKFINDLSTWYVRRSRESHEKMVVMKRKQDCLF